MSGPKETKIEEAFGLTNEEDQKFSFEAQSRLEGQEKTAEEVDTPAAEAPTAEAKEEEAGQPTEPKAKTAAEVETPEAPAEGEEAQPADEQEPKEEDQPEPSERKPRAQRRIEALNAKLAKAEEEKLALLSQLNRPQYPDGKSPQLPTYEGRETVDPAEIQRDVVQTADQIAQARVDAALRQRDARDAAQRKVETFQTDLSYISTEYPVLNDQSPDYDPQLDEFIARSYEQASNGGRNDLRLKDFVDNQMAVAEAMSEKRQATQAAAVAKQAADTAVTPSSAAPAAPKRKFEDLSTEEMEAHLGWAK